jgi:ribosomal protein S18 acetylase RimI-like enzyme
MIRAVEAGDRAAWTQLWKAYLAFYETALPEEVYASTWSRLLDPSESTWGALALQDGEPVGLVPQGRGRGIGGALIDHVSAHATARGSSRVYWLTHESNAAARALYDKVSQRSGFIQYRRTLPPS